MKAKFYSLLSVLFLTTIGCCQKNTFDNNASVASQTFVSEWHNFTIEYPTGWKAEKRPDDNTVYLIGPTIDSASLNQDGAFGIKVFALPEEFTSEYTYKINMESFATDPTFEDFKIDSKTEILIDDKKAVRVIHSATVFGNETKSLQYYLAIGKKLFITGGSIPSQKLGKFEIIFDDIIKSMKFK